MNKVSSKRRQGDFLQNSYLAKGRERKEKLFNYIFLAAALISVISVIAIIVFVFGKGLRPFFGEDAYSFRGFITGLRWAPSDKAFGILYMIAGSLLSTLGAIVLGVPVGLLTAVYIAELAPKKVVAILKPAVELLAGIPSIIFGVFGLGIIVPLIKDISPDQSGQSMLAVVIVLTMMILPTIISLSESSIRAVPKSYKDASYGLGASKIQTIFKCILPASRSGILAAVVLGIGRAIGETTAVMMVAGNNSGGIPTSIWDKIRPLTSNVAMEMGYASGQHQELLFSTGVVLFIFIMAINFVLIRLTSKMGDEGESS